MKVDELVMRKAAVVIVATLLSAGCFDLEPDRSELGLPPGLTGPCYSADPLTQGRGICRSGFTVNYENESGELGSVCFGEVLPEVESCNGLDDDCDGVSDDSGVCANQALDELRAFSHDIRMVTDEARAGPAVIARPGGGPIRNCAFPAPLAEEDCVTAFLDDIAPAYGIDGVVTRLVATGAKVREDTSQYGFEQRALIGLPEYGTYEPMFGAWLVIDVRRVPAPGGGSGSIYITGARANLAPAPESTTRHQPFDVAWLPEGDAPKGPSQLGYAAVVSEDRLVSVPAYRVEVERSGEAHVLLVEALGTHRLLSAGPMAVRHAQIDAATGQASLLMTAAIAAAQAYVADLSALCTPGGAACPIVNSAILAGGPNHGAFHAQIRTVVTDTPNVIFGACPAVCTGPACGCVNSCGWYDGGDDIQVCCNCNQATAVHELVHRAVRAYWDWDCIGDPQCQATIEFLAQAGEAMAGTQCTATNLAGGASPCAGGVNWVVNASTNWAGASGRPLGLGRAEPAYVMANFGALAAVDDHWSALVPGRAIWLWWQALGGDGVALDQVQLLFWEAIDRLPGGGVVRFIDFYSGLLAACNDHRTTGTAFQGPHCQGACTFNYGAATCGALLAAFQQTGIVDCQMPSLVEICNGVDDDCDGETDEEAPGVVLSQACYGDDAEVQTVGFDPSTEDVGTCTAGVRECVATQDPSDCFGAFLPPGAQACYEAQCQGDVQPLPLDACGNGDEDCDFEQDEDGLVEFAWDADGDGYSAPGGHLEVCDAPFPWVDMALLLGPEPDCDDQDPIVFPSNWSEGQLGLCNDAIDNNCDGAVGDGCPCQPLDSRACDGPLVTNPPFCAPGEQLCTFDWGTQMWSWSQCLGAKWGGPEICDGLDNDCDGLIDAQDEIEGLADGCGPCHQEVCDGGSIHCEELPGFTQNACGGCALLEAAPGQPCNGGAFVCQDTNHVACVAVPQAACTGTGCTLQVVRIDFSAPCDGKLHEFFGATPAGAHVVAIPSITGYGYSDNDQTFKVDWSVSGGTSTVAVGCVSAGDQTGGNLWGYVTVLGLPEGSAAVTQTHSVNRTESCEIQDYAVQSLPPFPAPQFVGGASVLRLFAPTTLGLPSWANGGGHNDDTSWEGVLQSGGLSDWQLKLRVNGGGGADHFDGVSYQIGFPQGLGLTIQSQTFKVFAQGQTVLAFAIPPGGRVAPIVLVDRFITEQTTQFCATNTDDHLGFDVALSALPNPAQPFWGGGINVTVSADSDQSTSWVAGRVILLTY